METADKISIGRIKEAIAKIDPVFLNSPHYYCNPLSDLLQCRVVLKDETKNRGAHLKAEGLNFCFQGLLMNQKFYVPVQEILVWP